MLKKRLIFTLLVDKGNFQLSRNFKLQSVGNLEWLFKYFNFDSITKSVDELVILNVERGKKDSDQFLKLVEKIAKNCFMPIAVGGGVSDLDIVRRFLNAGADKIVVNSSLFLSPKLIFNIINTFGSQVIMASVDFLKIGEKIYQIYIKNGTEKLEVNFEDFLRGLESYGIGELFLTSIERDGTGQGYDFQALKLASEICSCPIIASGGVGNELHLVEGLEKSYIDAVSTANIFNFLSDGLTEARRQIIERGIPLSKWDTALIKALGKSSRAIAVPR